MLQICPVHVETRFPNLPGRSPKVDIAQRAPVCRIASKAFERSADTLSIVETELPQGSHCKRPQRDSGVDPTGSSISLEDQDRAPVLACSDCAREAT